MNPPVDDHEAWAVLIDQADHPQDYPPKLPGESNRTYANRVLKRETK